MRWYFDTSVSYWKKKQFWFEYFFHCIFICSLICFYIIDLSYLRRQIGFFKSFILHLSFYEISFWHIRRIRKEYTAQNEWNLGISRPVYVTRGLAIGRIKSIVSLHAKYVCDYTFHHQETIEGWAWACGKMFSFYRDIFLMFFTLKFFYFINFLPQMLCIFSVWFNRKFENFKYKFSVETIVYVDTVWLNSNRGLSSSAPREKFLRN